MNRGRWSGRGRYVYEGPWTGRPAAGSVPIRSQMQVTGPGAGVWQTDGTYWRPLNGRLLIGNFVSSRSTPIASLTGNGTAQVFTMPSNLLIPGGMANVPNARIGAAARIQRTALGGGHTLAAVGVQVASTPATVGLSVSINQNTMAATLGLTLWTTGSVAVIGQNSLLSAAYQNYNSVNQTANYGEAAALGMNNDLYVRAAISADAIAGDVLILTEISAWLEA